MIQITRGAANAPTIAFRSLTPVAPSFLYFVTTSAARSYATTEWPFWSSRSVMFPPIRPNPIIASCMREVPCGSGSWFGTDSLTTQRRGRGGAQRTQSASKRRSKPPNATSRLFWEDAREATRSIPSESPKKSSSGLIARDRVSAHSAPLRSLLLRALCVESLRCLHRSNADLKPPTPIPSIRHEAVQHPENESFSSRAPP